MSVDRIQGTDGIRRMVATSDDPRVNGKTPQEAFLQCGLLTPEFFELYAYAFVSGLTSPEEVVVGWDPRDPAGIFTGAAVEGIRKAGAAAVVCGVFPTPGVAIYLLWRRAAAALMITASHNFRDQNGIKIFRAPNALKLFPEDDRVLTRRVLSLDYARDVRPLPATGGLLDAQAEARRVFFDFHTDPRNSWLPEGETLGDFPLIVDPANGALSGLAAEVFRALHGGPVHEVNADAASGEVNRKSGVADLEGVPEIEPGDAHFGGHRAIQELKGRGGKAAVFDADGDRFYRIDSDPESGRLLVLSGDETAIHQARYLAPPPKGTLYVNTVESDLNAARAAQEMGYTPVLTGVGDKWVLLQAANAPERYGIGSEETGHNISRGVLRRRDGTECAVFSGNGLKSALNTFVATRGLSPREAHRPFPPGYKRGISIYYTKRELWHAGSEAFSKMREFLMARCPLGSLVERSRPEEPDMLYLSVEEGDGRQRAGVFVRNSGTEEKTGVNVRGRQEDGDALRRLGEEAAVFLARLLKNRAHPMAVAQRGVLQALEGGPVAAERLPVPGGVSRERLLEEMTGKEKVIRAGERGYERTELGSRMLEVWA